MGDKAIKSKETQKPRARKSSYFDYTMVFVVIFLICLGLVMLYSASSYTGANKYGNAAFFVIRQAKFAAGGLVAMFIFANLNYHIWKKFSNLAYLMAFILCFVAGTGMMGSASESHGSNRWIEIAGIRFQPSEIAKIAVILFLAVLIEQIPKKMGDWKVLVKLFATLIPIVGIVAWKNLSTAIIILAIGMVIIFVATPLYKPFVVLFGAGLAGIALFVTVAPYRKGRIEAWLSPELVDSDATHQTLQGLYAIGSGGLFGKGLGESIQKKFVPEAQNDMIFTIICEELGLFGGVCVIVLYGILIWRMLVIANNARDLYGALLVVGVMAHISLQVIFNIGVATNTIPNTGVTLPFFSYGGTSLMLTMAEMGLVLSVSRGIRLEQI